MGSRPTRSNENGMKFSSRGNAQMLRLNKRVVCGSLILFSAAARGHRISNNPPRPRPNIAQLMIMNETFGQRSTSRSLSAALRRRAWSEQAGTVQLVRATHSSLAEHARWPLQMYGWRHAARDAARSVPGRARKFAAGLELHDLIVVSTVRLNVPKSRISFLARLTPRGIGPPQSAPFTHMARLWQHSGRQQLGIRMLRIAFSRRWKNVSLIIAAAAAMLTLSANTSSAREELCDPSFQDCRAPLISLINAETTEIDVGLWFMDDARYSNVIVNKRARGRQDPDPDGSARLPQDSVDRQIMNQLAGGGHSDAQAHRRRASNTGRR